MSTTSLHIIAFLITSVFGSIGSIVTMLFLTSKISKLWAKLPSLIRAYLRIDVLENRVYELSVGDSLSPNLVSLRSLDHRVRQLEVCKHYRSTKKGDTFGGVTNMHCTDCGADYYHVDLRADTSGFLTSRDFGDLRSLADFSHLSDFSKPAKKKASRRGK